MLVSACSLVLVAAGTSGCGGSGGLTPGKAAAELCEFNDQNVYAPYFATSEMAVPRYLHRTIRMANGQVIAITGSDESGYSSLDTAEIFDQSTLKRDESQPESIVGTWFDTNFEGDLITMSTGRLFNTATELPDSSIILIGGVANFTQASPISDVEIYDQLTRTFSLIEAEMVEPRFRHATRLLDDGRLLVTGGQIESVFTDDNSGFFFNGNPVAVQVPIFPSTRTNEVFSFINDEFLPLVQGAANRPVLLTPSRGRAGHAMVRFAGPDNKLNSGDDLLLLVGGYQTQTGLNAPQFKFPQLGATGPLTQLEFYDPILGVFTEVPVLRMIGPRINFPQAVNLGQHSEQTIDGVQGMGNCVLICNGDNDAFIPAVTMEDEVHVATFTGFGPAQGLQLFRQDGPYGEHRQSIEAETALGVCEVDPLPCFGRGLTNVVPLPRRLNTLDGQRTVTWVYNGGGAYYIPTPAGLFVYTGGTIAAGVMFDPFWSLASINDFDASARDLRAGRRNIRNPVGVIGTWLALDGATPEDSIDGFGDIQLGSFAQIRGGARMWGSNAPVAGEDGIDNTPDDRVLLSGGGVDVWDGNSGGPGGEPSFPSSEIVLIPGTGSCN